jgi:hypothetical protein
VTIQEIQGLLATLAMSIEQAKSVVSEAHGIVEGARETAEHARVTAEQNETVFRNFMASAVRQERRCEEHRRRTDAIEQRLSRMEEHRGMA